MKIEPAQLHARKIRNLEALKSEIARCLEEEVSLKANDKNARVSSGSIGRSQNNTQSAARRVQDRGDWRNRCQ